MPLSSNNTLYKNNAIRGTRSNNDEEICQYDEFHNTYVVIAIQSAIIILPIFNNLVCLLSIYYIYFQAHPKYSFDYSVKDPHTGDDKEHWETRDGDKVKGIIEKHYITAVLS